MASTTFVNSVTLTDAGWFNDVNDQVYRETPIDWCGTAGGTANALTLTPTPAIAAYAAGQQFTFKSGAAANTGATTVAISGLGTIAVQFNGAACVGGEIQASKWYRITLDSTSTCQVETISNSLSTTLFTAAGDGVIGTAANAAAVAPLIYGKIIHGLTYDVGTDTTNDININTGGAMDATGARWMRLATALGKQSDVNWAVGGTTGAPAGWLDTGAVGNSDYYIWLILRSDTGVVDSICSLSSTAPTMPASYDFKRLIGWFKRVGGTIVAFTTYETEGGGIELSWNVPTLDVALAGTLTTSRRTDAVKVPLNFSVIAQINVELDDASTAFVANVCCPDEADAAPSTSAAPLGVAVVQVGQAYIGKLLIRTSAAGLIAARATLATVDNYRVATIGFCWSRRN